MSVSDVGKSDTLKPEWYHFGFSQALCQIQPKKTGWKVLFTILRVQVFYGI